MLVDSHSNQVSEVSLAALELLNMFFEPIELIFFFLGVGLFFATLCYTYIYIK